MKRHFKITYYNGIVGCDETEFVLAETPEDVEQWADDKLEDYAESYAWQYFGWDADYTDEEYEEYFAECGFDVVECDDDEIEGEDFEEI